jgi:hypothetical protein
LDNICQQTQNHRKIEAFGILLTQAPMPIHIAFQPIPIEVFQWMLLSGTAGILKGCLENCFEHFFSFLFANKVSSTVYNFSHFVFTA